MMPFKRALLALLIASSLFFSGCLGFLGDDAEVEDADDDQDPSDMDQDDPDGEDGEQDGEGGSTGNETLDPPVASISANLTEGAAPLAVSFTLDAEHDDPEGLGWSLDIGDDAGAESGEGLPATVNHTFDAAGNFTVVLTVSHGGASDEANVTIAVEEAQTEEPVELTGSVAITHPVMWTSPVGAQSCISFVTGVGGVDCEFFDIEEEWIGKPFTSDADEGDVDLEFRSNCDATSESVEMFGNDGHEEGTVPEGAGCVVVANFLGMGDFTVTIG